MKCKVFNRLFAVFLCFLLCVSVFCCSFSLTAFASGLVTEKPSVSSLPKSQQVSYNFYRGLFNEIVETIDKNLRNKEKIIAMNRLYYFSLMLDNSLNSSSSISNGNSFKDEYLWFYFEFYRGHLNWTDDSSVGFFTLANEDFVITDVEEIKFNIENLCFFPSNWKSRNIYYELSDPPDYFNKFKSFYNYLYSKYCSDSSLISGELVGIADPVISVKDFKDHINNSNTHYSPKNAAGRMSYRTDSRYQKCKLVDSISYRDMTFYDSKNGFVAVGGGDDMYIVLFYKNADNSYYSKYQLHFTVTTTENWYEDRDEIEYLGYNLDAEYWDMINGSYEQRQSARFIENEKTSGFAISYKDSYTRLGFPFYASYEAYVQWVSYKHYSIGMYASSYPHFYELLPSDLSSTLSFATLYDHFRGTYENHDKNCNINGSCDIGYIASLSPISMQYNIDTTKIPDTYYVTITGDTVYDYSITNPETGQSDTINNYITNNYTYVTNNNPGTGSGSGSGVGGNVTVGGKIDVGGSVGVDINVNVPDININVNPGNAGGGGGNYSIPNTDAFNSYFDDALDESSGFRQFLSSFFSFLPVEIVALLGLGLTLAIIARILGR